VVKQAAPLPILQLIASSHGGGATHVLDLATALSASQFQVTVAMPNDGGNISPQQIESVGAKFFPINIRHGFHWHELGKLRRFIQTNRFELVHVHGARAGLYGRLAVFGIRHRPKVLFSIHGFATPYYDRLQKATYLALEHLLQRVTDRTICVAHAEAELFLKYHLSSKEKVQVIHPGIPLDQFQKIGQQSNSLRETLGVGQSPVILAVCRLNIPRDFVTLFKAVQEIAQSIPDVRLIIAGDGPQKSEIENQILALNLTKHVHLLGFRKDIPHLMAMADVFVLTSYGWEGFPISALEAQAVGLPVVITDAGGSAEAVIHEKTGLVVPKCDVHALAYALQYLLTDLQAKETMSANGYQHAHKNFSHQVMISQIEATYHSLLNQA
jgi:glycosyltransferase involved in cell wall biosynthesis